MGRGREWQEGSVDMDVTASLKKRTFEIRSLHEWANKLLLLQISKMGAAASIGATPEERAANNELLMKELGKLHMCDSLNIMS
jgi:hypothetical protein